VAENKIEIKIVIDSKQAQAGVANVQSALGKMSDSAKPAKSGVDAVNTSLNNTKSVQAPSTFSAVSASVDQLRSRTTLLNSTMATLPSTVAPAVLSISNLNNTIASAKPATAVAGLSSALDTVRTSAATAGTSLGSAFKVQLPTEQINNVAAGLGSIELGTRTASSGIGRVTGSFTSLATKAGIAGAAIYTVMKTITTGFQAIRDGAAATDVDRVFEIQAQKMGDTADSILARIKASTQDTITDLQAKQLANQAGIANMTVENVTTTVAYLREYANATGKSFEQLMTTIFTGLSRGSTLMLDDAGVLIDQTDLVKQKERELGRELSALGQKKVIVAEAMRQMSENMDQFGDRTQSATTKLDRLTAKFKDFVNNIKKNVAKDINDVLVLTTGANSIEEKMKTLQSKIDKHSKATSYDPLNKYFVNKWQKELDALKTTAAELKRNSSLYKKATAGSGEKKPDDIDFKPEDFAIEDDKNKKDPLASVKRELEQLTGEQWRVQVAIDTVGADSVKKRIEEENANYKYEKLRLENDRTKENSAMTDKALKDLAKVHELKVTLIKKEAELENNFSEQKSQIEISRLNKYEKALAELDLQLKYGKITQSDYDAQKSVVLNTQAVADSDSDIETFLELSKMPESSKKLLRLEYQLSSGQITKHMYDNQKASIENQLAKQESDSNFDRFIETTIMTEYDKQALQLKSQFEQGELTDVMYKNKMAILDYKAALGELDQSIGKLGTTLTNQDLKGAFNAMTPAVADFLTVFAQTGKIDISGLANSLLQSLQAYAAQKVAHLTMEYLYNQIMSIVNPMNPTYKTAATAAAAGIPVFAGIVAGSGLAGMAHDGISAIPEDGTWLLQKNERIVGAELNRDLTTFLSKQTSNITNNAGLSVNLGGVTYVGNDNKRSSAKFFSEIEDHILKSPRIKRQFGVK